MRFGSGLNSPRSTRFTMSVSTALVGAGMPTSSPFLTTSPFWNSISGRLAAQEIEDAVIRTLVDATTSPRRLVEQFDTAGMPSEQIRKILAQAVRLAAALNRSPRERAKVLRNLVEKIIVANDTITIRMRRRPVLREEVASSMSDTASDTPI